MKDIDLNDFDAMRVNNGDVLMLRPRHPLSMSEIKQLAENLKEAANKCGVKFVVLDHDLDIVGVQSDTQAIDITRFDEQPPRSRVFDCVATGGCKVSSR